MAATITLTLSGCVSAPVAPAVEVPRAKPALLHAVPSTVLNRMMVPLPAVLTDKIAAEIQGMIALQGAKEIVYDRPARNLSFRADRMDMPLIHGYLANVREGWRIVTYDTTVYRVELPENADEGARVSLAGFIDAVKVRDDVTLFEVPNIERIAAIPAARFAMPDLMSDLRRQGEVATVSSESVSLLSGVGVQQIKVGRRDRRTPGMEMELSAEEADGEVVAGIDLPRLIGKKATLRIKPSEVLVFGGLTGMKSPRSDFVVVIRPTILRFAEDASATALSPIPEPSVPPVSVVSAVDPLPANSAQTTPVAPTAVEEVALVVPPAVATASTSASHGLEASRPLLVWVAKPDSGAASVGVPTTTVQEGKPLPKNPSVTDVQVTQRNTEPKDVAVEKSAQAPSSSDSPVASTVAWQAAVGERVSDIVLRWATKGGWQLAWEPQKDIVVSGRVQLDGDLESAIGTLLTAVNASSGASLQATLYDGNRMIRVVEGK